MDAAEWIARYAQAWRDKDDEAVAELFTPDAIYRSHRDGTAALVGPYACRRG